MKLEWAGAATKCGRYFTIKRLVRQGWRSEPEYDVFVGKPGLMNRRIGIAGSPSEARAIADKHHKVTGR